MVINNKKVKEKIKKIIFVYDLLGDLKKMFWFSFMLMIFAAVWEGVILTSLATFLQSIVDTTKYADNTFKSNSTISLIYNYYQQIPDDLRILLGFIVTAISMFIATLINIGIATYQASFSTKFIVNTRCLIFDNLCKSSLSFYDGNKQGELIAMVINEAWACFRVVKNFLTLIINTLKGIIYSFFLVMISVELTTISLFFSLIFLIETIYMSKKLRSLANITAEKRRTLTVLLSECIQGIKHIKLFNLFNNQQSSFRNNTWIYDLTNNYFAMAKRCFTDISSDYNGFYYLS